MILLLIGTKAQLIKMAPVMREMDRKDLPYRFVLTGQHQETMQDLLQAFGLRPPDGEMVPSREANTSLKLAGWSREVLWNGLLKRNDRLWSGVRLCLVHGDTLSTLVGALSARRHGVAVAHVEAGLRSFNLMHPFPEELIRILVSRLAEIHYCPGAWAAGNLKGLKPAKHVIVDTGANTLIDALKFAARGVRPAADDGPAYGVVSIHRYENLSNGKRFEWILTQIEKMAERCRLFFVLHPATRSKLEKSGHYARMERTPNVELTARMDYVKFVRLLSGASFLVTDGGSNQEEASYLGLPCLLMRKATERQEGLGSNVTISAYSEAKVSGFVDAALKTRARRRPPEIRDANPSELLVGHLRGYRP